MVILIVTEHLLFQNQGLNSKDLRIIIIILGLFYFVAKKLIGIYRIGFYSIKEPGDLKEK